MEESFNLILRLTNGLPRWPSGKESACQYRRWKKGGFDSWVRRIPWCRKWQPSPVFLPEKFHGQRSLVGYSPGSHKELNRAEHTHKVTIIKTVELAKKWNTQINRTKSNSVEKFNTTYKNDFLYTKKNTIKYKNDTLFNKECCD